MTEHYEDGGTIDLEVEEVYLADGTRLTEERAAELADEVRAKAGRPSLSAPGVHSPQLRFSVSQAMRDRLDAAAAAQGRPVSSIARDALDEYLARHAS